MPQIFFLSFETDGAERENDFIKDKQQWVVVRFTIYSFSLSL